MKWCMLAKQIPAEKCSHGKYPQVGREKIGQPFPSCVSALLGQMDWTASKAWLLIFLVLGIILLILPLASHQVIRFSSQALGLPDSKLFNTRLGFFFGWYLIEHHSYADTVSNSLIFVYMWRGPLKKFSIVFFSFLYWLSFIGHCCKLGYSAVIMFLKEECWTKVTVREAECVPALGPLQWYLLSCTCLRSF